MPSTARSAATPIADFLMGYLSGFTQEAGQFLNNREKVWGFYAQDSWKVTRRLTLNYGIRYEYTPFFTPPAPVTVPMRFKDHLAHVLPASAIFRTPSTSFVSAMTSETRR